MATPDQESELEKDNFQSDNMCNEELEQILWYHPNMTRHVAEGLLMANGNDGTYLLRPSKKGQLSLSVRCANSVKHFQIGWDGKKYTFGMGKFDCLKEFVDHFENKPLIGGDSGILTLLKYPYPRDVEEPEKYETVRVHAEWGKDRDQSVRDKGNRAIATREGYLTKQGGRVKNWKTRWFAVNGNDLKYYKVKGDDLPLRTLDLTKCEEIGEDDTQGKANCFKIVMPYRTFYCFASSRQEADEWVKLLRWKMDSGGQNNKH
ncbi:dual adapter for phosphotyrosine and 3-phosphotyrosine and 3-phosphoinositide-like [Dendronephthya gigantea]|uniref:dual adapter for phosphotyrosine and 3-phosphotyrosine and 3-phosphoinositide-like n=1 Tax=Dendronephthya gigantea TaxID=151771 RepID=UPI00106D9464|nr:dual adapter for phosphotyrosine and 3-phosphotyrosine and 3-phosphoinositide-like [Dendronephthya gigantea]